MMTARNLGFGTPIRISPYGVASPVAHPEILGHIVGWNYRQTEWAHIPPWTATVAGFSVGESNPGWQGTPHKIGLRSPDNWATDKIAGGIGDFDVGGQVEGVASSPARHDDALEFSLFVRSALGTRREANPQTAYPLG